MPRILAIKLRRLGDTVIWTSALDALTQIPNTVLDIAYPAPYQPLFDQDQRFHHQFALKPDLFSNFESIQKWRKARYDYVLCFHANRQSRWLASFSGALKKGIHHHSRIAQSYGSEIRIPNLGKPLPATERDLNLVRAIGWQGVSPEPRILRYPEREKLGLEFLNSRGFRLDRPLVLLGPTASRPSKQWPLLNYAELSEQLSSQYEIGILAENGSAFGKDPFTRAALSKHAKLLFTPSLELLMGVLPHARFFIGADSGVKHIACALGVQTLTLFGPESIGEWHPYDRKKHAVIQKEVACRFEDPSPKEFSWCGENVCPLSSHACLNLISVSDVVSSLNAMCLPK